MPFFNLGLGAAGLHTVFPEKYPLETDLLVCSSLKSDNMVVSIRN